MSTTGSLVEVVGEVAELREVHLGVLVLAQVVLQLLQLADERLAVVGGEQRPEALEQVAQPLGVLAQVVQALAGRVGGDGPPVGEDLLLGLLDALGHDAARAAGSAVASTFGSASHVRHSSSIPSARRRCEHLGQLAVGGGPPPLDLLPHLGEPAVAAEPERARRSRPTRRRTHRGRGPDRSAGPARRTPPGSGRGRRRAARPCPPAAPCGCAAPRRGGRAGTPRRCPRSCRPGSPRWCRRGSRAPAGSRRAPAPSASSGTVGRARRPGQGRAAPCAR